MTQTTKTIIRVEILIIILLSIALAFAIIWANAESNNWEPKGAIVAALLALVFTAKDLLTRLSILENNQQPTVNTNSIVSQLYNGTNSPATGQINTQINNFGLTQEQINSLLNIDNSEFITFKSLRQTVHILDSKSEVSYCIKSKTLIANQDNIRTLDDRGFTTDGKFNFVSSSLGTLLPPKSEGGKLIITTLMEEPLVKGKVYNQELFYEVYNCFPEETETISLFAEREYTDSILIDVVFPKDRPVKTAKSYVYEGERRDIFETPLILNNGYYVVLIIPRPKKGFNYILEWAW